MIKQRVTSSLFKKDKKSILYRAMFEPTQRKCVFAGHGF
jgi:hypothetical protein